MAGNAATTNSTNSLAVLIDNSLSRRMDIQQVFIQSIHPFPTITLTLPSALPLACLPHLLSPLVPAHSSSLSLLSGRALPSDGTLSQLPHGQTIRVVPLMRGGKGGFGSQLRAAGGRMSSRKRKGEEDYNSCRDLEGRRLGTVKEAKKLEEYLNSLPERERKRAEEERKRLEDLKEEVRRLEEKVDGKVEGSMTKKRKLDASEVEEGRKRGDKVRNALGAGMLFCFFLLLQGETLTSIQ
ncbi:hypothetical protein BT69DRAFT_747160 [Atractiella rhizophila]|nr:hypothetical protein BT69DRAFT_747160 [Atractiella rhizophila]